MYDKSVKEVATEKIQKEFLTMEEQEVCNTLSNTIIYTVCIMVHTYMHERLHKSKIKQERRGVTRLVAYSHQY